MSNTAATTQEPAAIIPDLSEFESTMEELASFSKAWGGKSKKKVTKMVEEDDEEDPDKLHKEPDGDESEMPYPEMAKSVLPAKELDTNDGPAMDADAFLEKSHKRFAGTLEKSVQPQNQALGVMAKGMVIQGQMMKSLMETVTTMREELAAQGNLPKVRKSQLSVHEPQPSGQVPASMTADNKAAEAQAVQTILAKSILPDGLVAKGIMHPEEVSILEHCRNRGEGLPPNMRHLLQYAD